MSGTLVDTNVFLDIYTQDPNWAAWSAQQIQQAANAGRPIINPIIYAELGSRFASAADLDAFVPRHVFRRKPLPYAAGWITAQAFIKYRRSNGQKLNPLPDFYIGAHAEVSGLTVLTRDPNPYKTYFPNVPLIHP